MHQPLDLDAAVVAAWHATADELPGIRMVLDHYRAEPLDDAMAAALATSAAQGARAPGRDGRPDRRHHRGPRCAGRGARGARSPRAKAARRRLTVGSAFWRMPPELA